MNRMKLVMRSSLVLGVLGMLVCLGPLQAALPMGPAVKQLGHWLTHAQLGAKMSQDSKFADVAPVSISLEALMTSKKIVPTARFVPEHHKMHGFLRWQLQRLALQEGESLPMATIHQLSDDLLLASVNYFQFLQQMQSLPTEFPSYLFGRSFLPLVLHTLKNYAGQSAQTVVLQQIYQFSVGQLHPAYQSMYASFTTDQTISSIEMLRKLLDGINETLQFIWPRILYTGDGKATTFAANDSWGKVEGLQLLLELLRSDSASNRQMWENWGVKAVLSYHHWSHDEHTRELLLQLRDLRTALPAAGTSMEELVTKIEVLYAELGIEFSFEQHYRLFRAPLLLTSNAMDAQHVPLTSFLGLELLQDLTRFPDANFGVAMTVGKGALNRTDVWTAIFQFWGPRVQKLFRELDFQRPEHRMVLAGFNAVVTQDCAREFLLPLLMKAVRQVVNDPTAAPEMFRLLQTFLSTLE